VAASTNRPAWNPGDFCRALYEGDEYEATIVAIDQGRLILSRLVRYRLSRGLVSSFVSSEQFGFINKLKTTPTLYSLKAAIPLRKV
jgi:hypothetical protein